jgi:quercetin dioxygenase-like cupin family protein
MNTIVRDDGEGEKRWFYGGGVQTWKVTAEQTNGALSMFEDTFERGKTTPLHAHPESDEIVYVLEGEILIHNGGNPRTVGKGGVVFTPRGVPHAFVVTSASARILGIVTPGARIESFYRQASTPGESGPVDFGKVAAAAKETGLTNIMGPPPFQPDKS